MGHMQRHPEYTVLSCLSRTAKPLDEHEKTLLPSWLRVNDEINYSWLLRGLRMLIRDIMTVVQLDIRNQNHP